MNRRSLITRSKPVKAEFAQDAASALRRLLIEANTTGSPAAIRSLVDVTSGPSLTLAAESSLSSHDVGFWIDAIDSILIIAVTDPAGKILYSNARFCEISGYKQDELIGANHRLVDSGFHDTRFFRDMYATIGSGNVWRGEICNKAKDGSRYWVAATIIPRFDACGSVVQYVAFSFDITGQKQTQEHFAAVASIDPLTGLLNRRAFDDELLKTVDRCARDGQQVALVLLDLDNFKGVNDTYGHEAGDELLKAVSVRIRRSVRPGDAVARLGGDEIAILFSAPPSENRLDGLLDGIRQSVKGLAFDGSVVNVSSSIGVAIFPEHGATATELIRNADVALYNAKRLGRNRYEFYSSELRQVTDEHASLLALARNGLASDQFSIHYHPIISINDGSLQAVKTSLVWNHPRLGVIGPSAFTAIFEDLRLSASIGKFSRGAAVSQIASWIKAGIPIGKVAIQPVPTDFLTPEYCRQLLRLLSSAGLNRNAVSIDVSERLLAGKDSIQVKKQMLRLHEAGFEVSLTDFGAGYAALTHLKELPIAGITLDPCFVRDLPWRETDQKIARAIIGLAHSLGVVVTAKGVETSQQLMLLRQMRCDRAEGLYF